MCSVLLAGRISNRLGVANRKECGVGGGGGVWGGGFCVGWGVVGCGRFGVAVGSGGSVWGGGRVGRVGDGEERVYARLCPSPSLNGQGEDWARNGREASVTIE